jgi:hypothetical protein
MGDHPQTTAEWAAFYRSLGWSVIPLRPRDKKPRVAWEPFQSRIATDAEIAAWFGRRPAANIGIVTGGISGLVVVDVDPAHGGERSLASLEARHGPLPKTVEAVTGGGGRHLYFRHPGGVVPNRVGLAAGIDVRGDGGYVVAPPSLHPSGVRYAWVSGRDPATTALAPLPHWVADPDLDAGHAGHPIAYWRALVGRGVAEGERNNSIAALTGRLLWHGLDPQMIADLLLCWNAVRCRPPLPEREVIATVESIARTHERHRRKDS